MIDAFRGKYYFLSNFYEIPVMYKGLIYENNEAAFHAQKDVTRSKEFTVLCAPDAKRLGRKVRLRSDWNEARLDIMYEIVKAKFEQNEALKDLLIKTGDEELVEGNTWNDTFWGVCNGIGQNNLGKILMRVRSELK